MDMKELKQLDIEQTYACKVLCKLFSSANGTEIKWVGCLMLAIGKEMPKEYQTETRGEDTTQNIWTELGECY